MKSQPATSAANPPGTYFCPLLFGEKCSGNGSFWDCPCSAGSGGLNLGGLRKVVIPEPNVDGIGVDGGAGVGGRNFGTVVWRRLVGGEGRLGRDEEES